MAGGMREFLAEVAERESGGNHRIVNRAGFVGKYQFGEAALIDLGYYKSDGSNYKNNWKGGWTGKDGINSLEEFRSSPSAQDIAGAAWFKTLCKRAKLMGLDKYVGKTINGILITESGILAGAHLVGMGTKTKPAGVGTFLLSNGRQDPMDGMKTRASDYIRKFGGYNLGCHAGALTVAVHDRNHDPVSGVGYEIRSGGAVLQKGVTDPDGNIRRPVEDISFSTAVEFWIDRMEGGLKQVWNGIISSSEHSVVLKSPKVKVTGQTRPHSGASGEHRNRTSEAREEGRHTVKQGDSLWAIAQRHGITVTELRKLNPELARSDIIHPGQVIKLRGSSNSTVVKRGDTLAEIANRSGTNVAEIQHANPGLSDPNLISPGQVITLPTPTNSSAHAPKSNSASSSASASQATPVSKSWKQSTRGSIPVTSTRHAPPSRAENSTKNSSSPQQPGVEAKLDRSQKGRPITVVRENKQPLPSVENKTMRMFEILAMNVKRGVRSVRPNGPTAAANAKKNIAISPVEKREGKSLERCYMYVKVALQASGMVNRYLGAQAAKDAGPELKAEGFVNLLERPDHGIKSPFDAPVGSIIVYGVTDGSEWGHIEVRMDDGTFASDYRSDNSRVTTRGKPKTMSGRKRKVIGVWVKL